MVNSKKLQEQLDNQLAIGEAFAAHLRLLSGPDKPEIDFAREAVAVACTALGSDNPDAITYAKYIELCFVDHVGHIVARSVHDDRMPSYKDMDAGLLELNIPEQKRPELIEQILAVAVPERNRLAKLEKRRSHGATSAIDTLIAERQHQEPWWSRI